MCKSTQVGITGAKCSGLYFAVYYVNLFKTRTAKHKRTTEVAVVFHDEFVQCFSMSFNKFSKYCSRGTTSITIIM